MKERDNIHFYDTSALVETSGIRANSPAINWTKFLIGGFWPMAVANSHHAPLKYHKLNAFAKAVHDSVGGKEKYYQLSERVEMPKSRKKPHSRLCSLLCGLSVGTA